MGWFFDYVMTEHRSKVVVIFALPLSLLWDLALFLRVSLYRLLNRAPAEHGARVARVSAQVKARPKGKRIVTGRPGWQSISLSYRTYKQNSYKIDTIRDMIDIISIDTESAEPTITVEPLVSMGQLTRALLPLGFTLPVVPEMDDLTVGGLVNGTGIESTSHRCGLFHEQCIVFEICLADGTVVRATETGEHADLFHAVPWSYGTLGLLLSVTMRIVLAKPFVKLTYHPYPDAPAEACAHLSKLSSGTDGTKQPYFVEAIAFSASKLVVMEGEPVDAPGPDGVVNTLSLWYKPWFFKHVEMKLSLGKGKATIEYVPLRDYYHRHSKSMFWEMELMLPIGNHPLVRPLTGWMLPPKVSFLKLTQSEATRKLVQETHVAQDFMLPMSEMPKMLRLFDKIFQQTYPSWLCPHVHSPMPGTIMVAPPKPDQLGGSQMYVDIGVYGLPKCVKDKPVGHGFDMKVAMRHAEAVMRKVGGVEMLYADIYQTREEFEQMYPHEAYRALREKYGAVSAFPEVYDKINVIGVSNDSDKIKKK